MIVAVAGLDAPALLGRHMRVDSSGDLYAIDHPRGWEASVIDVALPVFVVFLLACVIGLMVAWTSAAPAQTQMERDIAEAQRQAQQRDKDAAFAKGQADKDAAFVAGVANHEAAERLRNALLTKGLVAAAIPSAHAACRRPRSSSPSRPSC